MTESKVELRKTGILSDSGEGDKAIRVAKLP